MSAAKEPISVLVAVNNRVLCEGIKRVAAEAPQNHVVCLWDQNLIKTPDVILIDANHDLAGLRRRYPDAKTMLLDSGLKDQEIVRLLVWYKVRGIISPTANVPLFHKAIRVVHQGEIWLEQQHVKALLQRNNAMMENGEIRQLSSQDLRIVQLISRGCKNREIAEILCLSEHTIKAHVSRIYKLLSVTNRSQLVSIAKEYDADF